MCSDHRDERVLSFDRFSTVGFCMGGAGGCEIDDLRCLLDQPLHHLTFLYLPSKNPENGSYTARGWLSSGIVEGAISVGTAFHFVYLKRVKLTPVFPFVSG